MEIPAEHAFEVFVAGPNALTSLVSSLNVGLTAKAVHKRQMSVAAALRGEGWSQPLVAWAVNAAQKAISSGTAFSLAMPKPPETESEHTKLIERFERRILIRRTGYALWLLGICAWPAAIVFLASGSFWVVLLLILGCLGIIAGYLVAYSKGLQSTIASAYGLTCLAWSLGAKRIHIRDGGVYCRRRAGSRDRSSNKDGHSAVTAFPARYLLNRAPPWRQ